MVDTSGIADSNGLTSVSYSYQWYSDSLKTVYIVRDETRFELTSSHAGKKFQVRVAFTDDAGHEETLWSAATAAVAESTTGQQQSERANQAPTFDANLETTLSLPENSPAGTNVGSAITATDPDAVDTLTYSLSGTDAESFDIGSSTGQITTKTGVTYDYETKNSYSLTVTASDGKGLSASTPVTVNLTDVAECRTQAGTLSGSAGFSSNWEDADCRAHHQDSRARYFHFTLTGQTDVTVTLSSGALYVSGDTRTDWGATPKGTYEHRINVRTNNGKLLHNGSTGTATLALPAGTYTVEAAQTADSGETFTLEIGLPEPEKTTPETPANTVPSFGAGVATTLAVDENSPAGTNVGDAITATDPDEGDTLTYSLTGTDSASFAIDSSTGQITTIATSSSIDNASQAVTIVGVTYDYETKASYSLTVDVSDGNGGTASTPVTVNLNNVNEAPSFADDVETTLSVDENSAAGTSVGDPITATDPDTGDTLTYSLTGTDVASFSIDSAGQITTVSGVTYDYEADSSYSLTVTATDAKGLSDSIDVTVNLTDVAEPTAVTACRTTTGALSATAVYAGKWDDAACKAHHEDSRARYIHFTVATGGQVTIKLSAGTLYVSKGTPNNGWGAAPKGTYEHRREVRRANGKLLHDGNHANSNTVTLSLAAGHTYTVEAAGASGGTFTVSIAPQ